MTNKSKIEIFKEKVLNLTNNEYECLSTEYSSKQILMKHNCSLCNNHEWFVRPSKFISDGTRCPICSKRKKKKEYSKELQYQIIELYKTTSIKNIAKKLHLASETVKKILELNNIKIKGPQPIYSDELINQIYNEYNSGQKLLDLSKKYNITEQTLMSRFKKLGFSTNKRKYTLNENYFENIDSQNKAYLLGFIMADGCISNSDPNNQLISNRLTINISSKDKDILEFIKKELNCNYNIKDYIPKNTYAKNQMSELRINSTKICSDLAKYGIIPRKTGHEILPTNIPDEYIRHFIRGFLDGDGYITHNGHTIGFCSNYNMLLSLKEYLNKKLNLESIATIRKDSRNISLYYVEFSYRNDIIKLKNFLYNNANFYFKRKYNKLT